MSDSAQSSPQGMDIESHKTRLALITLNHIDELERRIDAHHLDHLSHRLIRRIDHDLEMAIRMSDVKIA